LSRKVAVSADRITSAAIEVLRSHGYRTRNLDLCGRRGGPLLYSASFSTALEWQADSTFEPPRRSRSNVPSAARILIST